MVGIKHPSREVQQDNANRRAGQYVHLVPETSICDGFWPEDPRNFHKTIEAFRFVLNVLRFWPCAICICHHGRAESAWTWAPVDLQGPELTECRRSLTESVTLIHVWSCSYCAFRRQNLPGSEIHAREQRRRSELQSRKFDFVSNELYIYIYVQKKSTGSSFLQSFTKLHFASTLCSPRFSMLQRCCTGVDVFDILFGSFGNNLYSMVWARYSQEPFLNTPKL